MKNFYILFISLFLSISSFGQFTINEVYTDNNGGSNQFVEINGPVNTPLASDVWSLELYDHNGNFISTKNLPATSSNLEVDAGKSLTVITQIGFGRFGFFWNYSYRYAVALIHNGTVIQFFNLSTQVPRRTVTANSGTANGQTSNQIGRYGLPGKSIQITDTGWDELDETSGAKNTGQTGLSVVKNNIEGFKMYPNPVSNGQLNITSNSWADKQIEIYSMNGQQVYSKLVKHREALDIYSLNKGIYLVRIIEEEKIATRKLVVN